MPIHRENFVARDVAPESMLQPVLATVNAALAHFGPHPDTFLDGKGEGNHQLLIREVHLGRDSFISPILRRAD